MNKKLYKVTVHFGCIKYTEIHGYEDLNKGDIYTHDKKSFFEAVLDPVIRDGRAVAVRSCKIEKKYIK